MTKTSGYKISIELWLPLDLSDTEGVMNAAGEIMVLRNDLLKGHEIVTFETKYVHRRNRKYPERDGQMDIPEPPAGKPPQAVSNSAMPPHAVASQDTEGTAS